MPPGVNNVRYGGDYVAKLSSICWRSLSVSFLTSFRAPDEELRQGICTNDRCITLDKRPLPAVVDGK